MPGADIPELQAEYRPDDLDTRRAVRLRSKQMWAIAGIGIVGPAVVGVVLFVLVRTIRCRGARRLGIVPPRRIFCRIRPRSRARPAAVEQYAPGSGHLAQRLRQIGDRRASISPDRRYVSGHVRTCAARLPVCAGGCVRSAVSALQEGRRSIIARMSRWSACRSRLRLGLFDRVGRCRRLVPGRRIRALARRRLRICSR